MLSQARGSKTRLEEVATFLNVALDKYDSNYTEPSYIARNLLPMPQEHGGRSLESMRDRLLVQLVTDAIQFEVSALDGRKFPLPKMRPGMRIALKRCHHGLRAIRPALIRMGFVVSADEAFFERDKNGRRNDITTARKICTDVRKDMSTSEKRALKLSLIPVYTLHDEYLFLRTLQAFETNFVANTVSLRAAVRALDARNVPAAVEALRNCQIVLHEVAPLFSLIATMQVAAFRTFRAYTDGASAIQSESYKAMESLCARPPEQRLNSVAYYSVPKIRERIVRGQRTVLDAFNEARHSGDLSEAEISTLVRAMDEFEAENRRWRQTHYRLAVRMLGSGTGTGYTQGTPYLHSVIKIPLFPHVSC